jgi:hypothetical protein
VTRECRYGNYAPSTGPGDLPVVTIAFPDADVRPDGNVSFRNGAFLKKTFPDADTRIAEHRP